MTDRPKRKYVSKQRDEEAAATRARVLAAAKRLFAKRGIDPATITDIAHAAKVSASTVYALFRSKAGVLQALMEEVMFGEAYQRAIRRLDGVTDPVQRIALTGAVARAIYESENTELGLFRAASAFSPALRDLEQVMEATRLERQRERLVHLFREGKARPGLSLDQARRLMWMYTSRDVFRMLVHDSKWTPAEYERWLSEVLVTSLVAGGTATGSGA